MDPINEHKIKEKNRVRSTAYPSENLELAVRDIKQIERGYGTTLISRDMAAKALGYKGVSGASARRTAALVHFGLLTRKGNNYRFSDLSKKIIYGLNDREKAEALIEAFLSPKLFKDISESYSGQELPTMLENILIRIYQINPKVASEVTQIYKSSAEYAGVLKENRLIYGDSAETQKSLFDTDLGQKEINTEETTTKGKQNVSMQEGISIPLAGGAHLFLPQEYVVSVAMGKYKQVVDDINTLINSEKMEG